MKTTRFLSRSTRSLIQRTSSLRPTLQAYRPVAPSCTASAKCLPRSHAFSTTTPVRKGLQPDTSDPVPPNPESHSTGDTSQPAKLTDSEYHELSDQYMNDLNLKLEEKAETPEAGYEVEFSAGVLTLTTPKGIYVINKQPPNKQIWLSSPITGPKRFDWVTSGEGQAVKEGTETTVGDDGNAGGGRWTYLRDGTNLTDLLKKEIEIDIADSGEPDALSGREGPGGSG